MQLATVCGTVNPFCVPAARRHAHRVPMAVRACVPGRATRGRPRHAATTYYFYSAHTCPVLMRFNVGTRLHVNKTCFVKLWHGAMPRGAMDLLLAVAHALVAPSTSGSIQILNRILVAGGTFTWFSQQSRLRPGH